MVLFFVVLGQIISIWCSVEAESSSLAEHIREFDSVNVHNNGLRCVCIQYDEPGQTWV